MAGPLQVRRRHGPEHGPVTLNPVAHIDPFGTILLPLLLVLMKAPPFGWAKPVPSTLQPEESSKDNLWISAAGPMANVLVAILSLLAIILIKLASPGVAHFLRSFLSGRGGLPRGFYPLEGLAIILFYGVLVNTYLVVFNLIPVPRSTGAES